MRELLPCPFCGDQANLMSSCLSTEIVCANDQCISRHDKGGYNGWGHEYAAVEAWNSRTKAEPDPLLAQMAEALNSLHHVARREHSRGGGYFSTEQIEDAAAALSAYNERVKG